MYMTAAEVLVGREAEAERVLSWRVEELERAGYEPIHALRLAERTDVDLHLAINLLRDGCPALVALDILL
jgi:hypothetical protein